MSTALQAMSLFRRHVPDVPEDIDDLMEHFNDPNWDFRPPSPTLSTESIDLDQKVKRADSSRLSTSDFDTESHVESSYGKTAVSSYGKTEQSKSQLWSSAASDFEDESPYPEVQAAVANTDDPSMPVNTFRTWFLGVIFVIIVTGINQLMALRTATFTLNALVVQVAVLPFGKFMAYALPTTRFRTLGYTWTLNPGPFNVKEHTVITAMANICWTTSYVLSVYLVQQINYGQQLSYAYKILLGLSTNMIGISFAGLYRQVLIYPSSMIFPGTLVSCSLMNTLHRNWGKHDTKHLSRHKFFAIATACATIWYWVPGYLFTGLSVFSWACWIAPTNPTVNTVFGSATGLGMGLLTFDWSMISIVANGSPLVSPWWAELNVYGMFIFLGWIIAPILYFTNTFYAKYMPISATIPFDNTGLPYDVSLVITNGTFDEAKYSAYSPLFLTTTNALTYAVTFAIFPAAIVHIFLWYGRDIIRQFRTRLEDNRDVHSRLMMVYEEVPLWWYGTIFLLSFVAGVVAIEIFPTGYPVWALVVSILIPFVCLLPAGIIRAVTNQWITLNFLGDLAGSYIIPGKPVAHMIFKTYVSWPHEVAIVFLADSKLGHYMKVPPKLMFMAQTVSMLLTTFVSQGVVDWVVGNVADACTPLNTNGFTCPSNGYFGDSAIIWGAVGAQRLFSVGQLYNPFLWAILIGTLLPIPLYILARRYPYSRWRYVNVPVALSAAMYFPPATGMQFTSWFIVAGVFQGFMRRFHFRWWMRYNYVLSAALDAGVAFGGILVVLFTALPKGGLTLTWWGNTVWQNTNDAMAMPFTLLPPNATFGPSTWS